MKFRKDFVTNSSSSSYVCELCGRVESGFDISLSDAGMVECVNGHTFCADEQLQRPSKEEMIKMILMNGYSERYNYGTGEYIIMSEEELTEMGEDILWEKFCTEGGSYGVPESVCPICQFIEYSECDLSEYLLKEYGIPRDEVFAEVKKNNKRRRKLYDNEYITYVCQHYGLNPAEIVAGWSERFGTYSKFKKWLNE